MSGDNLTRDQLRVGGGGGVIPHRFFFVCVQGNNLKVDFLRKNIVARISTNSFMGNSKGNGRQDNSQVAKSKYCLLYYTLIL